MKPILIVKTGCTYPDMAARYGDFDNWFVARMDRAAAPIDSVSPFSGQSLPSSTSVCGVIITGSHDMVSDRHPWSEKTAGWIKQAVNADIPVLGVCYGHQLLAHAMGGVVGDNPQGKEIGTVSIRLNAHGREDRLFSGTPQVFSAHASHTQSVLDPPIGATVLASSDMDPHHAFVIGKRAWGIQFHPEFDRQIIRLYILRFAEDLRRQGSDVGQLLADVGETPHSELLLRRFQALCA